MPNYLSRYDAESLPRFEDCVVFNGTKVLFTPAGIQRYKERFARAGFDIAAIEDADQFERALVGSYHIELACFLEVSAERRSAAGGGDALEWQLGDALRAGDHAEAARLKRKLRQRRRAGLQIAIDPKLP